MKVIDMLNNIANEEGVPKKIKYENHIYEYEEGTYDWSYYVQNNGTVKFLLTDIFNSDDNILTILNEEVEIIEENKKIGKYNTGLDNGSWNEESVKKGILEKNNIEDYLVRVMKEVDNVKFKVFEIIDKLNEVEK